VLQRLRDARRNDEGFTLIELLIVIVILGVLAGIVVFAVNGITDRGQLAACRADVKTVQVASEAYYAKNGSFAQALVEVKDAGGAVTTTGLVPKFLQAAPLSTNYVVTYSQKGPDNTLGTDDDGSVSGVLNSGGNC
jgi:general secretion pathway protein G